MMKYITILVTTIFIALLIMACSIKNNKNVDSTTEVRNALTQLLNADHEKLGFIIIEGKKELEYIQFGREHYGLMLMWPLVNAKYKGLAEINRVKIYLNERDFFFKEISHISRQDVLNLLKNEYVQNSEGIYANVGNNADEITELVKYLFQKIYEYEQFHNMKIELVLDNS